MTKEECTLPPIEDFEEFCKLEFPLFRLEHNTDNNTLQFGPLPEQFFKDSRLEVIKADPNCLYEIDLDNVQTPLDVLNWMHHLCSKYWITTVHIHILIDAICEIKGWDHHKGGGCSSMLSPDEKRDD